MKSLKKKKKKKDLQSLTWQRMSMSKKFSSGMCVSEAAWEASAEASSAPQDSLCSTALLVRPGNCQQVRPLAREKVRPLVRPLA